MEKQKIVFPIILILITATVVLLVSLASKREPFKEKAISDSGWLIYDNTEAGFRVNYPPDWRLGEIDESSEGYKRMTLSGSEGEILFDWGGGFGGYCEKWEEVNIKNEKMTVCNRTDQEGRKEIAFGAKDLGQLLFSGAAFVNKPITEKEEVVYKILATLEFYNLEFQQRVENSEKVILEQHIKDFEETLDLDLTLTDRQEKFLSFFTDPKTSGEQQEKEQLFCEGPFPCLWVSTSSLAGVSRYELMSLKKISDGQYQALVKEWVIHYSALDGEYIETGQRINPLKIVKEGDRWLIESYGSGGKYFGVYAGLE